MKKLITLGFTALFLTSCAPATETYCKGQGLMPGTANFNECMGWASQSESQFGVDRERCLVQAKITYPETLYDRGRTVRSVIRDRRGRAQTVESYIEPDSSKNAEVDRLRETIINPCMLEKGWHSPTDWRMGREKKANN